MTGFWIFGGVITIVVVSIAISKYQERKRTAGLEALAAELGLSFSPKPGVPAWSELKHFRVFSHGHSQRAYNLMRGETSGIEMKLFDFYYSTGSGKSRSHYYCTIAAFEDHNLNLPMYLMRPESFLDRLGLNFDGKDINFDDRPVFSKRYLLTGKPFDAVRELFQYEVTEFCEQEKTYFSEGQGHELIFCVFRKQIPVKEYREFFRKAFEFYALLRDSHNSQSTQSAGRQSRETDSADPTQE